jgi:hypothetical protein
MMMRLWRCVTVVAGGALAGSLVADPAWAAGLEQSRRGTGIVGTLLLVCCLMVAGLVAVGVVIGLLINRRRGGRPPAGGPPADY